MEAKTIQLGGSFEATVTDEMVTFNKPVTNLGMFYIQEIAELMGIKTEGGVLNKFEGMSENIEYVNPVIIADYKSRGTA